MNRILSPVERFLNNIIGGVILLGMMSLVSAHVISRYLFKKPILGATEISEFIMVGLVYFTIAHTEALKAHIKVDILTERLSTTMKTILWLIASLIGLFIFAFIVRQGVLSAMDSWHVHEGTLGVISFPTFPVKLIIPFGSFLLCLRFIQNIIDSISGLLRKRAK